MSIMIDELFYPPIKINFILLQKVITFVKNLLWITGNTQLQEFNAGEISKMKGWMVFLDTWQMKTF